MRRGGDNKGTQVSYNVQSTDEPMSPCVGVETTSARRRGASSITLDRLKAKGLSRSSVPMNIGRVGHSGFYSQSTNEVSVWRWMCGCVLVKSSFPCHGVDFFRHWPCSWAADPLGQASRCSQIQSDRGCISSAYQSRGRPMRETFRSRFNIAMVEA
jgi:hypothetical protein